MRLLLAALLLLGPAAVHAEPALLLPPSLGRTDAVWVAGRALRDAPPDGGLAAVKNTAALAARNWVGATVEVTFQGVSGTVVSGHDGEFEVELRPPPGASFAPGPGRVEAKVRGASARGVVHVVPPDAPFIVISDFDDTVAVTNVASKRKVLATAFLDDERTQPPVPGMAALYRCLASRAPAPAFAFVSGSPVQMTPRVERFLARNGFPRGALYLRNLGPTSLSGYKEPVLRTLADRFRQPFLLVGDSGEHDPEIYAAFARAHPGRVLGTWIRRAGKTDAAERFEGMLLFGDPREPLADAAARALSPSGCALAPPAAAPQGGPAHTAAPQR